MSLIDGFLGDLARNRNSKNTNPQKVAIPAIPATLRNTQTITTKDLSRAGVEDSTLKPTDRKIYEGLMARRAYRIWSEKLNESIIWVKDDVEKERLETFNPTEVIYTYPELVFAIEGKWTKEFLNKIHQFKKELGGILSHSKEK